MPRGAQMSVPLDHECAMMIDFRNGAGLSLEKAAEATHYERRTVSRYEKYPEKANPQAILALANVYQSNEMLEWYCTEVCEIGKVKHCKMPINDLSTTALRWIKELKDVIDVKDRLVTILCDGRIDSNEVEDLTLIMKEIDEFEAVVHSLRMKVSHEMDKLAKKKPAVLEHDRLLG